MHNKRSIFVPISVSAAVPLILLTLLLAIAPAATSQTFGVIHYFTGPDGATPLAGLTIDRAGNLYGTAFADGAHGYGNVFKLTERNSHWLFAPLYSFAGGSDGAGPYAGVSIARDGTLYGTTSAGGAGGCNFQNGYTNCGTIFHLRPSATFPPTPLTPWHESVIYRFTGGADGAFPGGGNLAFDNMGNIYGTTEFGGLYGSCFYYESECGVVYELTPSGDTWTQSVLWEFGLTDQDGEQPWAGVTFDPEGNIYGTASRGGGGSYPGVVYKLTPAGSGWTEGVLYSFADGSNGETPNAGLILDSSGNLYGATSTGGSGGGGDAFKMTPSGNLTTLYSFTGPSNSGPYANLVMDSSGNLYGTTYAGGTHQLGSVFELAPSSNGWIYTDLHDFSGSDGAHPISNVTFDTSGNLYGTASAGGNMMDCGGSGCGVVWEITPQ